MEKENVEPPVKKQKVNAFDLLKQQARKKRPPTGASTKSTISSLDGQQQQPQKKKIKVSIDKTFFMSKRDKEQKCLEDRQQQLRLEQQKSRQLAQSFDINKASTTNPISSVGPAPKNGEVDEDALPGPSNRKRRFFGQVRIEPSKTALPFLKAARQANSGTNKRSTAQTLGVTASTAGSAEVDELGARWDLEAPWPGWLQVHVQESQVRYLSSGTCRFQRRSPTLIDMSNLSETVVGRLNLVQAVETRPRQPPHNISVDPDRRKNDQSLLSDLVKPRQIADMLLSDQDRTTLSHLQTWLETFTRRHQRTVHSSAQSRDESDYDSEASYEFSEDDSDFMSPQGKRRTRGPMTKPQEQTILDSDLNVKSRLDLVSMTRRIAPTWASENSTSTMLIYAPPSSGKTTWVHLLAEQLGMGVVEVSASTQRSGSDLKAIMGETITSHSLHRRSGSGTAASDRVGSGTGGNAGKKQQVKPKKNPLAGFIKRTSNPKKSNPTASSSTSTTRPKPCTKQPPSLAPVRAQPTPSSQSPQKKKPHTLIVLEDVELLFQEDAGFWNQVLHFAKHTHHPIVLTASDLTSLPRQVLAMMDRPGSRVGICALDGAAVEKGKGSGDGDAYLRRCVEKVGVRLSCGQASRMMMEHGGDLRKCLNQIDFLSRLPSTLSTDSDVSPMKPNNTHSPSFFDRDDGNGESRWLTWSQNASWMDTLSTAIQGLEQVEREPYLSLLQGDKRDILSHRQFTHGGTGGDPLDAVCGMSLKLMRDMKDFFRSHTHGGDDGGDDEVLAGMGRGVDLNEKFYGEVIRNAVERDRGWLAKKRPRRATVMRRQVVANDSDESE